MMPAISALSSAKAGMPADEPARMKRSRSRSTTALRNRPLRRFDAADRVALGAVAGDAARRVDRRAVGDVRLGVLSVVQGGLCPGRGRDDQCRHEGEARNLKESTHRPPPFLAPQVTAPPRPWTS